MRKWVMKPVNFDRTNKEEMELYEFAGRLPNFTVMAKNWLRSLRAAGKQQQQVQLYDFISRQPTEMFDAFEEWVGDVDEEQFL